MQFDYAIFAIVVTCGVLAIAVINALQVLWWMLKSVHCNLWHTWCLCGSWWRWLFFYKKGEITFRYKLFAFAKGVIYRLPDMVTLTEFRRVRGHREVFWRSPFDYTL